MSAKLYMKAFAQMLALAVGLLAATLGITALLMRHPLLGVAALILIVVAGISLLRYEELKQEERWKQ